MFECGSIFKPSVEEDKIRLVFCAAAQEHIYHYVAIAASAAGAHNMLMLLYDLKASHKSIPDDKIAWSTCNNLFYISDANFLLPNLNYSYSVV